MKILLQYLRPHRTMVALVLVLAAINISFSLLDPIIFGKLISLAANYHKSGPGPGETAFHHFLFLKDRVTTESGAQIALYGVIWLVLASITVAMVSRIAKNFQDYFLSVIMQKFGAKVFTDGLRKAMRLPYQDFEDQRSGETLSVLTNVRADTEKFIYNFVNILFTVFIGVIIVAVFAAFISPWLPIVYFGGTAILMIISNLLSKKVKRIQKTIVAETNALAGTTTESLRNIELVKSLGLTNQEVERLNNNTYKILGLEIKKVKRVRSIGFVQGTFVNTLRQVILLMLMFFIFRGKMDAGQLVTMQIFSFFIFGPLQDIANIILSYREAEASLNNFQTLMARPLEAQPEHPHSLGPVRELRFDHVSFKHRTAMHKAIDDISFDVNTGETIAFVGPSGSGKTTLMKLLVGLYRPQEGNIFYNGVDENSILFDNLRNQIGFVTQDTQLFSGTIRENLLFVNPAASDEELFEALRKASCTNLLARAEKGVDTMIGEGGLKLSGGEKQRLSIARALLRQPKVLIFDEATSALDSLTEEEINQTIRSVSSFGDQITILIAHRLSTIMHADRIYVLERGVIVETGSHEALLDDKGLYYAMWRQQIGERKATAAVSK